MSEPWIVYALIFALITGGVYLAQFGLRGQMDRARRVARRFEALVEPGLKAAQSVDALRSKPGDDVFGSMRAVLELKLAQAGLSITPATLIRRSALLMVAGFFVWPAWLPILIKLTLSAIVSAFLVHLYLAFRRQRRISQFAQQLPEVIDVVVRSLRAGHPLPVSFALVVREIGAPAGPAFAAVVDELNFGRSIADALTMLEMRIDYRDVRFFVSSIAIAQQTGGNLAEILARLAKMLRERARLRRKIKALSAEGRFSGYALSSLPVLLFGLINIVSPPYYQELWQSPAKLPVLLIAGGLLLMGNLVIYKLVNFKV